MSWVRHGCWVTALCVAACGNSGTAVSAHGASSGNESSGANGTSPAEPPADGEPGSPRVELRFHWLHGQSMSVRVTHQRQRDREQARSTITYTAGVLQIDGGLRINYGGYMPYLHIPHALPTEQHGMRERLAILVPELTIDEDGNFTELPGLQQSDTKSRLKALKIRGKQRRRAARGLTDVSLTRAAKYFWQQRVGRWHGQEQLVRGEVRRAPDVLQVHELGGATVDAMSEYRFIGWAKCTEDAADARCVEIHVEITPAADAMDRAIKAFRKARGRYQGAVVREVDARVRIELITDPTTLRPHRYEEDHFTMVRIRDRRGNETQSLTTDSQLEEYSYR